MKDAESLVIEVLSEPIESGLNANCNCGLYCPPDCGCENAWNTCFIGD